MSRPDFTVLVVDDEELYARAIGRELERQEITCDLAYSGTDALRWVESRSYQVILLDHRLPDEDGIRLIPLLLARQPAASLIMMTAYHTVPNAVLAIRHGADDYIIKETSLQPIVERVLEVRRRQELRSASNGWQEHKRAGLIGRCPGMLKVLGELKKIAGSPDTTVLITGETGVGKEVAANFLHRTSRPEGSPMVTVDCVALPPGLAESLLFGHERGAFTGADQSRVGAFEEARDGTLFLDEIGDMDALQAKLLRVLESRSFRRVGSLTEIPLRARVVAATNQDLKQLVKQGQFRLDLYQRLCVFPIQIPPLRDRGDDILLLAEHFRSFFAEKLAKDIEPLGEEVRARLSAYTYPGNVRELKNIIERAVIMTESGRVALRHLPQRVLNADHSARQGPAAPGIPLDFVPGIDTLESLERRMIKQALERAGYVKAAAARQLGISRYQLLRRMEKYGIHHEGDDLG
ncbi:MAG: sigma-54-dependent Fis family transcriptional regulator [Deltaproteobacteria bacterium]|jgi:DNA-binding NtrC family response regulator|nr:sigma-54-dependent Fis family transcriptional regulator [Deltaproteobacteria bacterium]